MALAGTTIFEVETGGDDTNNGGAFDPGQTAGMFTDGAATSANTAAPVFTSASYSFVAGDVGAWVFIGAGTNWTKGWYKIDSVSGGAATLNGTSGSAVASSGATTVPLLPSTVVGCATVASPTGATWSIDYSQQSAAAFTYTDLASTGAGLTVSSAAFPFAKQQVGNCLVITGGTNFTAGRYVIASVAAGVATVVGPGNITTGIGASGTGGQGGALASPGLAPAHIVASNQVMIKTGTYTVTSASTNIAAGCLSLGVTGVNVEGYAAVRGDLLSLTASGTRPTLVASGISTFTLITNAAAQSTVRHLILDGASLTSSRGVSGNNTIVSWVHVQNMTNSGFSATNISCDRCSATGCSTIAAFLNPQNHYCVAYANTVTGFNPGGGAALSYCLSYNNSGASSDGFLIAGAVSTIINCVAYGNGRDGFRVTGSQGQFLLNCIGEANTGVAFTSSVAGQSLIACAEYNNTGGVKSLTGIHARDISYVTGTATFFTAAASGDFSLNNMAGGGALLRQAGYPGVFPVGLTTGYLDIGAAQAAAAAGSPYVIGG